MSLITAQNISIKFGVNVIFKEVDFSLEENERVCIIGRNGAGKSTLMKVITETILPDSGEVNIDKNIVVGFLSQSLPDITDETVFEFVKKGLQKQEDRISDFQDLSIKLETESTNKSLLKQVEDLHALIDIMGGWDSDQRVKEIISQLGLPEKKKISELSGGWLRRVSLGQVLVEEPDLLLLDEPTNHLDINSIEWLEYTLKKYSGSVVFITHDRSFLQNVATRILEIDRTKILNWPGNYKNYIQLKIQANIAEDSQNAVFDKKLKLEEEWIRKGVKARRSRNMGRVRNLEKLRDEKEGMVKRQKTANISISSGDESGRKVVQLHNVSYKIGDSYILKDFKMTIQRGSKIGIVGNNGVGKTTLFNLLLAIIEPTSGSIKIGSNINLAYYNQTNQDFDLNKSVADNVNDGGTYIKIGGKERHIIGYLKSFLFSPEKSMEKMRNLSGGERNRAMLAKILSKDSNLLILDEPTNDLDVELIEVLEEQLKNYTGTLLLTSHDREFLDNCVDKVIVFEEDGVHMYEGNYSLWAKKGIQLKVAKSENPTKTKSTDENKSGKSEQQEAPEDTRVQMNYKIKNEYKNILDDMPKLEKEIKELTDKTGENDFYNKPFSEQ
jgi:ATP-binding cassette subfamily F protein uup